MQRVTLILIAFCLFGCYDKKPKDDLTVLKIILTRQEEAREEARKEAERQYMLLATTTPPEVPAPLDHPPLKIVAKGDLWTVHYTTKDALLDRGCGAYENNDTKQIWLPRKTDYEDQRKLLIHELPHVSLYESRKIGSMQETVFYNEDENSFISPMAPRLLQILQDNPKLLEWLIRV